MLPNSPMTYRNTLDSRTHPQIHKRLMSGKPFNNLIKYSKNASPTGKSPIIHHSQSTSSPTPSQNPPNNPPSISEIDSKLPDLHSLNSNGNNPNPIIEDNKNSLASQIAKPLSRSFDTVKKWGKDAAHPKRCNPDSMKDLPNSGQSNPNLSDTYKLNQALYEETYGNLITVLSQSTNDKAKDELFFLTNLYKEFKQNPQLNNRARQLTLETFLARSKFNLENVQTVIGPTINIDDKVGLNEGKVDQGTFFTAVQSELLNQSSSSTIESITVVATPQKRFDLSKLSSDTQKFIQDSKLATGQSVCDVILNGPPFDFKIITDNSPTVGKNHIVGVAAYNSNAITNYLIWMEQHLQHQMKIHPKGAVNQYYKEALEKLANLKNENSLTPYQRLEIFNEFTISTLYRRPHECHFSLLYTLGDPLSTPNRDSEYARLAQEYQFPSNKKAAAADVAEANRRYLAKQSQKTQELFYQRTNALYGSPTTSEKNKSTSSYPDEVD